MVWGERERGEEIGGGELLVVSGLVIKSEIEYNTESTYLVKDCPIKVSMPECAVNKARVIRQVSYIISESSILGETRRRRAFYYHHIQLS